MNVSVLIEIHGAMLPVIAQIDTFLAPEIATEKPLENQSKNVGILVPEWPTEFTGASSSLLVSFGKESSSVSESLLTLKTI
jgi:hypothetical protein